MCSLFLLLVFYLVMLVDGSLWIGIKYGVVCWIGIDFECVGMDIIFSLLINGLIVELDGSFWISMMVGVIVCCLDGCFEVFLWKLLLGE